MNLTDRNAMLEKHWALAKREAKRASRRVPVEYGDLLGEAAIGMLDAAERFDPEKGAFSTLAVWRMRGAMTDYVRSRDGIGRTRREEIDALDAARDELANELLRTPSTAEVYERLDVSPRKRRTIETALVQIDTMRLDHPAQDGSGDEFGSLHGHVPSPTATPEEAVVGHERRSTLLDAIAKLPHKQRIVVVMSDLDRITMKKIAVCLGVSESRVSMIRKEAHKALRTLLAGSALDPAA